MSTLKANLEAKYDDHLFFAEVRGKRNVICFRNMASCIINEKWYSDRKSKIEDESLRIVIAAAKLIKAEIRELQHDKDKYPLCSDFSNLDSARSFVPDLLSAFMRNIVCTELKQVALSHCIIQGARPRSVISPIPFAVGVSTDTEFGSKKIVMPWVEEEIVS